MESSHSREIRCPGCRKLLAKGQVIKIQIKCPRCREITTIERLERPLA